jgi:hypothetical protein
MTDSAEIQEWKHTAQALLEKQRHLDQLLVRVARGDYHAEMLDQVRAEVEVLRELEDATFNAAFGVPVRAGR